MKRRAERFGMSLIEVMIAMSLLTVVIGGTMMAIVPMVRSETHESAEVRIESMGMRALQRIADDLREAGLATIDGADYPHVFSPYDPVNGAVPAGAGFDAYNALPPGVGAPTHAAAGADPDFGATTQIVFRVPQDQDGNGTPTVSTGADAGDVEWSANDITYCLVSDPAAGNLNELRRYSDYAAGTYEVVASSVERAFFERRDGSGSVWDAQDLHANGREIRVTLQFRVPDATTGTPVRGAVSTVVSMRN